MKKLVRFALVGSTGFAVDAGLLWLLLSYSALGPLAARALAILVALLVTWRLNRAFTFGASRRSLPVEGFRYGSVGVVSALVNYGLYAGLLIVIPALNPFAALVFASLAAMAFSFFGYSRFVFRR
ncbi:GtrA family protein [Agrobacterium vitis]|uniref:GtrA family protein n=1 Tax=Rhizobium/Agrobacterium group TaxID=227290 RepID=UPI0008DC10C2|nr:MULTISPECIES: GtrA family protein [Rhizobium/Agrobacterium group]MCF1435773.1 GtrA family protein [Allorhizobium ampelinum]MUO90371.1 GtrA family protein [Agrobacterium vitis]MUZ52382.1 GtrA family protein [Agrobacterium vitis]MUZ91568.1 GtrA family protein [Agrobacterium vitis]MVA39656.1 GtrA family protein [Agrobacterium vitis]